MSRGGRCSRIRSCKVWSPPAVDLSLERFDEGISTYYEVLEAQQQLFPAQLDLARTMRDQLVAVVLLYRALGGGWNLDVPQWVPAQPATH